MKPTFFNRLVLAAFSLLAIACGGKGAEATAQTAGTGGRTLVVYYSFTGNVKTIASAIGSQLEADMVEIQPAEKGLDYAADNYAIGSRLIDDIRRSPNDAGSYPAIDAVDIDFSRYANVIIATPLWWGNMAAPMQTFLYHNGSQMAGKNIGLVVSSASSGISGVVGDAERLVPAGNILLPHLWIRSAQTGRAREMVKEWLDKINFNSNQQTGNMRIKISDGNHSIVFELNETSAAKSLYGMLPLEVKVENYSTNEKIFYPPTTVSFGVDCIEGDCPAGTLALFSPWGNVVMFYGAAGRYNGLYILGKAIDGADGIRNLSGTICVEKQEGMTGIGGPKADTDKASAVYRPDGSRAPKADTAGVYIHGGKKFVKR